MPPGEPPHAPVTPLARQVIAPGTALWRVHPARVGAAQFVTGRTAATGAGEPGGRFDALQGEYPTMYVSFQPSTAVAERLVRDAPFNEAGTRTLTAEQLAGMVASAVLTTGELTLLRLVSEADYSALGQLDEWLVTVADEHYGCTRRWAAWLRDQLPDVHGIVWQSSVDLPAQTAVLFGDRCPPGALRVAADTGIQLDSPEGVRWLVETLRRHRIRVEAPDPAEWPLIFLNYRGGDDTGGALELLDRELTRRLGEDAVFRDTRSLRVGHGYDTQLLDRVRRCKVLIVLIGRFWEDTETRRRLDNNQTDWTRREIVTALGEQGRVTVVPVLVGARAHLQAQDLPEDLHNLAKLQTLMLRAGYTDRDIAQLVGELFQAVPLLAEAERSARRARSAQHD